jgi:hypothetical protein
MVLMARTWEFNASLARVLGAVVPEPALRPVLLGLLVVGVLAAAFLARDLVSRALYALIALVVVTPTLHPWYLVWAVPLLTLRPHVALIALSGLAPLTYVAIIDLYTVNAWNPPLWPTAVSYGVFYALLVAGAVRVIARRLAGSGR